MSLDSPLEARLDHLERSLRRSRRGTLAVLSLLAATVVAGATRARVAEEEITTYRLVILDDEDRPRLILGQDPEGSDRVSRSTGLLVIDQHGDERGGFVTRDDDGVVFAMDAPVGVGHPMRDRLGLLVGADGAAEVRLIDNQARVPVRMITDAEGGGGIEFLQHDPERRTFEVQRTHFGGSQTSTHDPDGGLISPSAPSPAARPTRE